LRFAYGPALIAVGMIMLSSVTRINFDDLTEVVPVFATIVMMLFTYNIANGLTAGLALYPIVKLASGRFREVNLGSLALGLLCLLHYVSGVVH
jgi:adenine/guanine/hypoxanthine permease